VIGLAIWLQALLATQEPVLACAGTSDELRFGLFGILQAVEEGRCEVVL
jgi:hypothetical protein